MRNIKIDWFKALIGVAMFLAVLSLVTVVLVNREEQEQLRRITRVEVRLDEEAKERIRLNCRSIQVTNQAVIQLHNRVSRLEAREGITVPVQILPRPPSECTGEATIVPQRAPSKNNTSNNKNTPVSARGSGGAVSSPRGTPTPTGGNGTGSKPDNGNGGNNGGSAPNPTTPGPTPTSPTPTSPPPSTPPPNNPPPSSPSPVDTGSPTLDCVITSPILGITGCIL